MPLCDRHSREKDQHQSWATTMQEEKHYNQSDHADLGMMIHVKFLIWMQRIEML
ncbi:hypothetical protein C2S51_010166 [Perilla frutescens var. frutescens]|nr:hypothetical protein C2S51_010166 [Perilla frutescens var. frutescens]